MTWTVFITHLHSDHTVAQQTAEGLLDVY